MPATARFAPVRLAYSALSLCALFALTIGCSHEVLVLGPVEGPVVPAEPLGLTVSLYPGSFDRTRLQERGVLDRFADEIREQRVFQAVLYPVPSGVSTRWAIELVVSDGGEEPNSNRWKGAIAAALPPIAAFVTLENDYTLRLEALLLKGREVVGSYVGEGHIQHRYSPYANRREMDREGVEAAVRTATRALLRAMRQDRAQIEKLTRTR